VYSRKILLAFVVVVGLLALGAVALGSPALPIVAPTPKLADQMTNIDVLRQEIKNYYGAPTARTGPSGTWADPLNPNSNYASEAENVAADGSHWLAAKAKAASTPAKKAIVLDVDDTTVATFNYELYSNWDYNPVTNADFVNKERFPAVPGMVDMVKQAAAEGYKVIWLTGRPATQEAATLQNLLDVGYPPPSALPDATQGGGSDGIFTKPAIADYPPYLTFCNVPTPATSCNTDEYKSATRGYIESLGYDIVASFGDQYSDFSGGFEDRTFKLPNPSYFLP
jgi:hypothetical protein